MTNSQAYLEGFQAFSKSTGEARNPYDAGTVESKDWEAGYFAAYCANHPAVGESESTARSSHDGAAQGNQGTPWAGTKQASSLH